MMWKAVNSEVLIKIEILIGYSDLETALWYRNTQKTSYFRTHTEIIKSNENPGLFFFFPEEVTSYLNQKNIIINKTVYSKI